MLNYFTYKSCTLKITIYIYIQNFNVEKCFIHKRQDALFLYNCFYIVKYDKKEIITQK